MATRLEVLSDLGEYRGVQVKRNELAALRAFNANLRGNFKMPHLKNEPPLSLLSK